MPRKKLTEAEKKKRKRQRKKEKQEYYKTTIKPKINEEKKLQTLTPKKQKEIKKKKALNQQREQAENLSSYLHALLDHNFDQHMIERKNEHPTSTIFRDTIPNLQFALTFFNNRFYSDKHKYFLATPLPTDNTKIEKTEILNQIIVNYTMIQEFLKNIMKNAILGTNINDTLPFLLLKPKQQIFLQNIIFRKLLDNLVICSEYITKGIKEQSRIIITDFLNSPEFNNKYTQESAIVFNSFTPQFSTLNTSQDSLYKNKQRYYIALDNGLILSGEDLNLWEQNLKNQCDKYQIRLNQLYSPNTPQSLKTKIITAANTSALSHKYVKLINQNKEVEANIVLKYLEEKSKNIHQQDAILFKIVNQKNTQQMATPIFRSEEASATFILRLYSSFILYIQRKKTKLQLLSADLPALHDQISTQYLSAGDALQAYKLYFLLYAMLFVFPLPAFNDTMTFQKQWQDIFQEDGLKITNAIQKIQSARTLKTQIFHLSEVFKTLSYYTNICFFPMQSFDYLENLHIDTDDPIDIIEQISKVKLVDYTQLTTDYDLVSITNQMCRKIIPVIDTMTGFEGC